MSDTNNKNPQDDKWKKFIKEPLFQGIIALSSFLGLLINNDPSAKIGFVLILFFFSIIHFRQIIREFIKIIKWLTWKFLLGFVSGMLLCNIFYPTIQSIYLRGISFIIPQVEIVSSYPKNGETLSNLRDSVCVNFSERLPSFFQSPFFWHIVISPNTSIRPIWFYEWDKSDCCQMLYIEPARFVSDSAIPEFKSNTNYKITIFSIFLPKPYELDFKTRSNEEK